MKYIITLIIFVGMALALPGTTLTQERIAIGDEVEGTLTVGERADYLFEAEAGQALIIELQGSFDTYLYLRDTNGDEIDHNDDGSDHTNSRFLGWVAPEKGTYIAQVASFADAESGTFTLSIQTFESTKVEIGESVTESFTEEIDTLYFSFDGTSGQLFDVTVNSNNTLDIKLQLIHPENYIQEEKLDVITSVDSGLSNLRINAAGQYHLVLTKQNENANLIGEVTVSVKESELIALDEDPVELAFDFDVNESLLSFDGTAGQEVVIIILVETDSKFASPRLDFSQENTQFANFSTRGTSEATIRLTVPNDGEVQVRVTAFNKALVTIRMALPA